MVTLVLLVAFALLWRPDSIAAANGPHNQQPAEYDDDYQYNDAEFYNYPDFGLKNGNVKLSTVKTVVQEKKYTPFIKTRFSSTTKKYNNPYTTSTTTTTTTTPTPPTSTTSTTTTTTQRPKYTRYTTVRSRIPPRTTKSYEQSSESHQSSEEDDADQYETIQPHKHYPKTTPKTTHRRKRPLANSSSNRNEVKLKPTSSFVEFYADHQESGESNEFVLVGQKSPSRPNEHSYQFEHPDFSPTPSRPGFENLHLFSTDLKSHKFGSQESDFGYFKPIITSPSPIQSTHHFHRFNRDKHSPVHTDLLTDLHLAELPLESVPSSLKHFHYHPKTEPFDSAEFYPKHMYPTKHSPSAEHVFRPSTKLHYGASSHASPSAHVASREQIDLYNNDLRDHYEAQLEKQLRNSKNPADRAKLHQFLKALHDEKLEQQQTKLQPLVPGYRSRHRPTPGGFHHSPGFRKHKPPPPRPFTTPGLRHFRDSQKFADRSYEFPFV